MRMILKDSEIGTCISALDFYSRMYMGQYGEIDFELRQYRFDSEFDNQYMFARKHIYTAIRNLVFQENKIAEWDLYGSLGIWSEDTDVRAKNAYDMQQVIRYYHAWCCNPEGGIGRSFDAPLFGGEIKPLKCDCSKSEQEIVMNISDIDKEHLEIMIAAARVYLCLLTIQINKLMKYYTKNENALELALAVEKLYDKDDLPAKNRIKKKINELENIISRLNELEAKSNM